jgi:hypothetical protein
MRVVFCGSCGIESMTRLAFPISKTDSIRKAWSAGDQIGALRSAPHFFDQAIATKIVKCGMDRQPNPLSIAS